jgi:hypothetical protein
MTACCLQVSFQYSRQVWAWHGWVAVHISVADHACGHTGSVAGNFTVTIDVDGKVIAMWVVTFAASRRIA